MEELQGRAGETQVLIEDISVLPTETLNKKDPEYRRQIESTLKYAKEIVVLADKVLLSGGLSIAWQHESGRGYMKTVYAVRNAGKFPQRLNVRVILNEDKELYSFEVGINEKGDVYHGSALMWERTIDGGLSFVSYNTPMFVSGPFFRIPAIIPFNPTGYMIPSVREEDKKICDLVLAKVKKYAGKFASGGGVIVSNKPLGSL